MTNRFGLNSWKQTTAVAIFNYGCHHEMEVIFFKPYKNIVYKVGLPSFEISWLVLSILTVLQTDRLGVDCLKLKLCIF